MHILPILDNSTEIKPGSDGTPWKQEENLPGMRLLREAIKSDLDRLETVSEVNRFEVLNLMFT